MSTTGGGTAVASTAVGSTAVGPLRSLAHRTPLRIRLVAAVLSLVVLALACTGVAAAAALRGYLVQRVDAQLVQVSQNFISRIEQSGRIPNGPGGAQLPSAFYFQYTDPTGRGTGRLAPLYAGQSEPALPVLDAAEVDQRGSEPFTVPAAAGDETWRVLVAPLPTLPGAVTVALSLREVDRTVDRLALIELLVSTAVLALLAGVSYAVIRSSLGPLTEVEDTARAIAAGDLSRRVPFGDPRTEVGQLSAALNTMLGQIESSFAARQRSEDAARASESRMRRFVADASHELRTPLTSIRGFAELYRQGAVPDGPELARVMRRIEDEAHRMGLLVEDLLLLARLDQHRPLQRRPVDLAALAAEAVRDVAALEPDRAVRLEMLGTYAMVPSSPPPPSGTGAADGEDDGTPAGPGSDIPVVLGDEARLRQVVTNLLANARTHTPPGTPITVAVGRADDGRHAVLEVRDAGPGMTAEQAERVFERFYRADTARSREQGGAGLGLAIVAALLEASGGQVSLQTAPGRGATFRVLLPIADAPADAPAPGRSGPAGPAPGRSGATPER